MNTKVWKTISEILTFFAPFDTIDDFAPSPNTIKIGDKEAKHLEHSFNTKLGPTLAQSKILDQILNSILGKKKNIYIYMYIYMLQS